MLIHKPMEQPFAVLFQFRSDNGGAYGQVFVINDFSQSLAPSIHIIGIPKIFFRIIPTLAGKYAVRTDMNKFCIYFVSQLFQQMREIRIYQDGVIRMLF